MIPRPAQNLTIKHRAGRLTLSKLSDTTHDTESTWELSVRREGSQHPVFLASLQHPPQRVTPAHGGWHIQ